MARSIQDRLIEGLQKRGWVEDTHHRIYRHTYKRYVVMKRGPSLASKVDQDVRYFVGKAGALRVHAKGRVSDCFPAERAKRTLLLEVPE